MESLLEATAALGDGLSTWNCRQQTENAQLGPMWMCCNLSPVVKIILLDKLENNVFTEVAII